MSAYEELIERCGDIFNEIGDHYCHSAATRVLAEVLRTLEAEAAGTGNHTHSAQEFREDLAEWLSTSSLNPPVQP